MSRTHQRTTPIVVDTSVWVDSLHGRPPARFLDVLEAGRVLIHPWTIGELALGTGVSPQWAPTLAQIRHIDSVADAKVLRAVHEHRLARLGIGWVDAHILVAALVRGLPVWSTDGPFRRAARAAGLPTLRV